MRLNSSRPFEITVLVAIAVAAGITWGGCTKGEKKTNGSKGEAIRQIGEMSPEDSLKLGRMARRREKRKVVLIGLDAASWNILTPMIKRGQLPSLERLLERSSYGELRSVDFFVTPPAWTALFSGCSPWKNGIYDFGKLDSTSGKLVPVSSVDVRTPRLWDMVSQAGLKTAVINIPLTYPAQPVNGIMVTGLLTPERIYIKERFNVEGGLRPASSEEIRANGLLSYSPAAKAEVWVYKSPVTAFLLDTSDDQRPEYDKLLFQIHNDRARQSEAGPHSNRSSVSVPEQIVTCPVEGFTPWVKILFERNGEQSEGWVRLGGKLAGREHLEITCTPVYRSLVDSDLKFCYPDSLKEAIADEFKRYIPMASHTVIDVIADFIDDASRHLEFFYDYDDWDLFIFQFQITDLIQHLNGDGKYTQDIYMRIDKIIGRLIDIVPENTTLILVSDHGSRIYRFIIYLNVWLKELGLIAEDAQGNIDYKHSTAYHAGWGIYINKGELERRWRTIRGFQPPKGASLYDAFIDFLIYEGRTMKYPNSNRPLPVSLKRTPEEKIEPAPDLYVEAEYPYYGVHHEDFLQKGQRLIVTSFWRQRKFSHMRNGMYLISGSGIKKGYKTGVFDILDITPTVLHLLGLPVADYFDGSVMKDILEEDFLASQPVEHIWSYSYARREVSQEDVTREKLEEKLKAIGYLE